MSNLSLKSLQSGYEDLRTSLGSFGRTDNVRVLVSEDLDSLVRASERRENELGFSES